MDSSVLAFSLGLVGKEINLGCVLGTCFCGWVWFFAPALLGFPEVLLVSPSLVGVWHAVLWTNVSSFYCCGGCSR